MGACSKDKRGFSKIQDDTETTNQMLLYSWCSRCIGGLSLCLLLFLTFWVLSTEIKSGHNSGESMSRCTGILTILYAYYSLLIHILVLIFPLRACWAIWDVNCSLKMMVRGKKWRNPSLNSKCSSSQSSSGGFASTYASLSPSISGEIESEYFADTETDERKDIYAILIPSYREDVDVLRETLEVLASHPQARSQYDVLHTFHITDWLNTMSQTPFANF